MDEKQGPTAVPAVASTRPILYLDVDGVLLAGTLAKHAEKFLGYCVGHYECRWLTTRCRDGDARPLMRHLGRFAGDALLQLAGLVRPTTWNTLKTDAIDPLSDFYWVDDCPLQSEQQWLVANEVFDRWIQADTRRRPDDLCRVLEVLRERTSDEAS
jgi:hypothetical protein